MARNIPKALATFVSSDPEVSRMYSHVQAALQPLLDFHQKWFAPTTPGNQLTVLGAVAATVGGKVTVLGAGSAATAGLTSFRLVPDGTQAAPGLAFATNGASGVWHSGGATASEAINVVLQGIKQISVMTAATIFQAPVNGAVAVFNDSSGNSLGTINGQGTVNMPSFVSAQGFKAVIPAGCYYLNNTAMTTAWTTLSVAVTPNAQNAATSLMPSVWIPCHSGSITGMSAYLPTARATGVIIYFRTVVDNGAGTITYGATFAVGNVTLGKFSQPYAKGLAALSFTAGCYVYIQVSSNSTAAASFPLQANLEVELGA